MQRMSEVRLHKKIFVSLRSSLERVKFERLQVLLTLLDSCRMTSGLEFEKRVSDRFLKIDLVRVVMKRDWSGVSFCKTLLQNLLGGEREREREREKQTGSEWEGGGACVTLRERESGRERKWETRKKREILRRPLTSSSLSLSLSLFLSHAAKGLARSLRKTTWLELSRIKSFLHLPQLSLADSRRTDCLFQLSSFLCLQSFFSVLSLNALALFASLLQSDF